MPVETTPTLIMGGIGQKTLQVVARHAIEWNCSYVGLDVFKTKSAQLDETCEAIGRDPVSLRRSVMIPFVIGSDQAGVQNRIDAHRQMFPNLPSTLAESQAAGRVCSESKKPFSRMAFVECPPLSGKTAH